MAHLSIPIAHQPKIIEVKGHERYMAYATGLSFLAEDSAAEQF
jgi:hypothetical protein